MLWRSLIKSQRKTGRKRKEKGISITKQDAIFYKTEIISQWSIRASGSVYST